MRIAKTSWKTKNGIIIKYDKLEHSFNWFILYFILHFFVSPITNLFIGFLVGLIWEIKDGFVPWEKYGWIGGEGFDIKDLIADVIGMLLGFVIFKFFSKKKASD